MLFAFGLGMPELVIIALVVLLLFGSRLPNVMRSLGRGMFEFKRGIEGLDQDAQTPSKRLDDATRQG